MATNATRENFFPKKIYAPSANPGSVALGIDAEGKHVNLEPVHNNACIGIMGMTGTGKSVVLQSVIEQYARAGAEVLYCGLKGNAPGTVGDMDNVVYVAGNADATIAAIDHAAATLSQRVKSETGGHVVVLVIDHVDMLVHSLESSPRRAAATYDTLDFIRRFGTPNNVVLILTSQAMGHLPIGRNMSRDDVFGSLVVAGGRSESPIPFPGAESREQRLPLGRCVYFTASGAVEFQAFMPNGDVSTIVHRHQRLVQQLVPIQ